MEGMFWWCFVIPTMIFALYHVVRNFFILAPNEREQQPIEIDLTPFYDAMDSTISGMAYGGFSKYQQPISDEKRKNDDDEVFDEKRKRLEDEEVDDEVYWTVGDDGELVEEKRKR